MNKWTARKVEWKSDFRLLRNLYNTTWKEHPITRKPYFDWQLLNNYTGEAIAFCAEPKDRNDIIAGVYLVLPTIILVGEQSIKFSTSLYSMTHPLYYKNGIFKRLAELTYEKCTRMGIVGTVGVPNNNSLPGFTKGLGFNIIGQYELMACFASPFHFSRPDVGINKINNDKDLNNIKFTLDRQKALSGVILGERSADFIRWRFLHCPGVNYHVYVALDKDKSATGLIVLRKAKKHNIPITVIVEFLTDHTNKDCGIISKALLAQADKFAWVNLSPFIVSLVNPFSNEAQVLSKNGYKKLPKKILPHESNFIIKFHGDKPFRQTDSLCEFKDWHFSFTDYDLF